MNIQSARPTQEFAVPIENPMDVSSFVNINQSVQSHPVSIHTETLPSNNSRSNEINQSGNNGISSFGGYDIEHNNMSYEIIQEVSGTI